MSQMNIVVKNGRFIDPRTKRSFRRIELGKAVWVDKPNISLFIRVLGTGNRFAPSATFPTLCKRLGWAHPMQVWSSEYEVDANNLPEGVTVVITLDVRGMEEWKDMVFATFSEE